MFTLVFITGIYMQIWYSSLFYYPQYNYLTKINMKGFDIDVTTHGLRSKRAFHEKHPQVRVDFHSNMLHALSVCFQQLIVQHMMMFPPVIII